MDSKPSTRRAVAPRLQTQIRAEVEAALGTLENPAECWEKRVHATRKHLKRLAALSRLQASLAHEPLPRIDRAATAAVKRRLGRLREPFAELELWVKISPAFPAASAAAVQAILQRRRLESASPERTRLTLQRCEQVLAGLCRKLSTRPGVDGAAQEFDANALFLALRLGYRKGRRALVRAQKKPNWQRLHALRRANQVHRHQLQFVEQFLQSELKAQRKLAARVSDQLGEHHDLGSIQVHLAEIADRAEQPAIRKKLRRRMKKIGKRALRGAKEVFAERPKAFERCVRRSFERGSAVVGGS